MTHDAIRIVLRAGRTTLDMSTNFNPQIARVTEAMAIVAVSDDAALSLVGELKSWGLDASCTGNQVTWSPKGIRSQRYVAKL